MKRRYKKGYKKCLKDMKKDYSRVVTIIGPLELGQLLGKTSKYDDGYIAAYEENWQDYE